MNLREKLAGLLVEIRTLNDKDKLSDKEKRILADKLSEAEELKGTIGFEDRQNRLDDFMKPVIDEKPELRAGLQGEEFRTGGRNGGYQTRGGLETASVTVGEDRSYRGMFPEEQLETNNWGGIAEFAFKVAHKLPDQRMERSLNEGLGSTGGFSVPTAYSAEIFNVALQSELVRPRAKVYPVNAANKLIVPGTVIGDHSSNLFGGVTCAWAGEEETLSDANPKLRDIELTPYKLTALYKASNEWFSDAIAADKMVNETLGGAIGWNLDRAFLRGSGAGQPLGILNADCTLEISKEGGQTADTVVAENIFNMVSSLHSACFSRSVWAVHPDVLAKLFSLAVVVGTGGSAIFMPAGGEAPFNTLLGRPVLVSEHCSPLGDAGDIILADFSQYAIAMRKDLAIDSSQHVHFTSDQLAFRGIMRVDGMPLWNEPLTLADGSKEVSCFVVIEDRA